jgi:SAM-dependent methyltransferase
MTARPLSDPRRDELAFANLARVRCAVCDGARFETLDLQRLDLVGLGRCDIAFGLCRSCGHIQQCPPMREEQMAKYYEGFSNYTAFADAAAARAETPSWCTRRLLSMTRDLGAPPGLAYEIGCAHGKHLHHFKEAGWTVGGCDLSPKAAEQAKTLFGIAVDVGAEADCVPRKSGLDLVLIVHVLEHLHRPAEALARIHEALAPGGHLVLEVPCAVAPERLPPGWLAFEHLHYFAPETLDLMLSHAGFETVETRITFTEKLGPVIIAAACKRAGAMPKPPARPPQGLVDFAHAYADRDAALWALAAQKLRGVTGEAFIWGGGVHTAQLLDKTGLAQQLKIVAIADRDPQKWGRKLGTIPVISPETLLGRPSEAPIIVSSFFAEAEIVRTLRQAGVPEGRILPLYGHA